LRVRGSGDDDLGGMEPKVERVEQRGVGQKIVRGAGQHAFKQPVGLLPPLGVAGECGKPQQVLRRQ
jgi:hypothetical protein